MESLLITLIPIAPIIIVYPFIIVIRILKATVNGNLIIDAKNIEPFLDVLKFPSFRSLCLWGFMVPFLCFEA